MDHRANIVVIGAGVIGSTIAFQLTRRHRNVTVVEGKQPGSGATLASYAWINSRDKSPREYHDLNRRSLDMWPRFAQDLSADIGLRWGGEMRWSATEEGAETLLNHAQELRSWGYPVIEMTKEQARVMEPGIVMEPFTSAVYCGIEGHVDTQRVVRACLNRVQQDVGHGRDVVSDFEKDLDTLVLSDGLWDGSLTAEQVIDRFATLEDGDAVFEFDGGETIALEGVRTLALSDDIAIV